MSASGLHFALTPDGATVIYLADQTVDDVIELYARGIDPDQDADGIFDVCDICPGEPNPDQSDDDGDGLGAACGDCDDGNAATYPGASEINDGMDNQCPGEAGYGLIDEISRAGFFDSANGDLFSWEPQSGATEYLVVRSNEPTFSIECACHQTASPEWADSASPAAGVVFHYLVQSYAPHTGSFGADSSGTERAVVCGCGS